MIDSNKEKYKHFFIVKILYSEQRLATLIDTFTSTCQAPFQARDQVEHAHLCCLFILATITTDNSHSSFNETCFLQRYILKLHSAYYIYTVADFDYRQIRRYQVEYSIRFLHSLPVQKRISTSGSSPSSIYQ